MENREYITDDMIEKNLKEKFKRAVNKIKAFTVMKKLLGMKKTPQLTKGRSFGNITEENIKDFISKNIEINSVLSRRLKKYKLIDGVYEVEGKGFNVFGINPQIEGRIVVVEGTEEISEEITEDDAHKIAEEVAVED